MSSPNKDDNVQGDEPKAPAAMTLPTLDTSSFDPTSLSSDYNQEIDRRGSASKRRNDLDPYVLDHPQNLADRPMQQNQQTPSQQPLGGGPQSSSGFFAQRDEFNVDQSVNFMDHSKANYTPPRPKKKGSFRSTCVNFFSSGDDKALFRFPAGVCVALMVMVVAGVCVLAISVPELSEMQQPTSDKANEIPPSPAEVPESRMDVMKKAILESRISDPSALEDTSSSAYCAMRWISDTDPAQLDPFDYQMIQRYALAVFFYANNAEIADAHSRNIKHAAPDWKNFKKWMTKNSVCRWYGVDCEAVGDGVDGIVHLNLTSNSLKGSIPPELQALTDLVVLDLSENELSGSIAPTIFQKRLAYILLNNNQLSGAIPQEIGQDNGAALEINLSHNHLTGQVPSSVLNLVGLRQLDLSHNRLHGELETTNLFKLSEISVMNLERNELSGPFPYWMGEMTKLVYLNLAHNSLSSSIPASFASLLALEKMHLGHNMMSGLLPEFTTLRNLTEIQLEQNAFQGRIPSSIGGLASLRRLCLDTNDLVGDIPPELTDATNLEELILHHNSFSGSIPRNIGALVHLRDLWLNSNKLTGMLPKSFESLSSLQTAYLESNAFSGTLSTSIGSLRSLRALRVHETQLSGDIPDEVCALKKKSNGLEFLSADCNDVRCACCDQCY